MQASICGLTKYHVVGHLAASRVTPSSSVFAQVPLKAATRWLAQLTVSNSATRS
jgi:hypothetical protein